MEVIFLNHPKPIQEKFDLRYDLLFVLVSHLIACLVYDSLSLFNTPHSAAFGAQVQSLKCNGTEYSHDTEGLF